jgi:hypothetical protein
MKWVYGSLMVLGIVAMSTEARAAALYDVGINAQDIVFDPVEPILNQSTQVYVTLSNNGQSNVEGTVHFFVDNQKIGSKIFSIRANGRQEDVWTTWTPSALGAHVVRVEVVNDPNFQDVHPEDNVVSENVYVDLDTDGDGVPDRLDQDRDNDGLTNDQEVGIRTNPLARDTDGDGVADKEDYYPLDAKRTRYEPPAPPVPVRPVTRPTNTTARNTATVPVIAPNPTTIASVDATTTLIEVPLEIAASTVATSSVPEVVMMIPSSTDEQVTTSTPASPPYWTLWVLAGTTGVLALGFISLDWWHGRRRD